MLGENGKTVQSLAALAGGFSLVLQRVGWASAYVFMPRCHPATLLSTVPFSELVVDETKNKKVHSGKTCVDVDSLKVSFPIFGIYVLW